MCVICVEWKRKKTNSCFWVVKRSYTQIAYRFVGSKATGSVITPKLMGTSFFQANVSIIICKMGILYARTHFTRVCNNIFRFLAPLNCRSFTFDFRNAIWISAVHQTTCNVKSKYGMCVYIYSYGKCAKWRYHCKMCWWKIEKAYTISMVYFQNDEGLMGKIDSSQSVHKCYRSFVSTKWTYTLKSNCSPPKSWQCRQAQTKWNVQLFFHSLFL